MAYGLCAMFRHLYAISDQPYAISRASPLSLFEQLAANRVFHRMLLRIIFTARRAALSISDGAG